MTLWRRRWLVAYDIAAPKRLREVRRFLVRRAVPVQYSVFVNSLTRSEIDQVLAGLGERIHPRQDDVRAYPLLEGMPIEHFGSRSLAEGILLAGLDDLSGNGAQTRRAR